MKFWLYGIEYEYSLPQSLFRDFKRETGRCLYQLLNGVYLTYAQNYQSELRAYELINKEIDVELASQVFCHLIKTERDCDIDIIYDACLRSGFQKLSFDTDEKIAPYSVILVGIAFSMLQSMRDASTKEADKKKLYPSSDTLKEILESITSKESLSS